MRIFWGLAVDSKSIKGNPVKDTGSSWQGLER